MSDTAYARITFDASNKPGGLQKQLARELCDQAHRIEAYDSGGDWDGPERWDQFDVLDWLRAGPVTLDGWPRYGEWHDLVMWLEEHEVPYDRFRQPWDMRCTPTLRYYRPGEEALVVNALWTDAGGEEAVLCSELEGLLEHAGADATAEELTEAVARLAHPVREPLAVEPQRKGADT